MRYSLLIAGVFVVLATTNTSGVAITNTMRRNPLRGLRTVNSAGLSDEERMGFEEAIQTFGKDVPANTKIVAQHIKNFLDTHTSLLSKLATYYSDENLPKALAGHLHSAKIMALFERLKSNDKIIDVAKTLVDRVYSSAQTNDDRFVFVFDLLLPLFVRWNNEGKSAENVFDMLKLNKNNIMKDQGTIVLFSYTIFVDSRKTIFKLLGQKLNGKEDLLKTLLETPQESLITNDIYTLMKDFLFLMWDDENVLPIKLFQTLGLDMSLETAITSESRITLFAEYISGLEKPVSLVSFLREQFPDSNLEETVINLSKKHVSFATKLLNYLEAMEIENEIKPGKDFLNTFEGATRDRTHSNDLIMRVHDYVKQKRSNGHLLVDPSETTTKRIRKNSN